MASAIRWIHWAHVVSPFRGQWLPGDARGFRDHGGRIRSHGTEQEPPPVGEHAGLRRRARAVCGEAITLGVDERERVGRAIVEKFTAMEVGVAALAVGGTHCHALIQVGESDVRPIFGRAKQFSSLRVRDVHPGKLWAASCGVFRMKSEEQFESTRGYIAAHKSQGAWVYLVR